jgi:hypothetical protein
MAENRDQLIMIEDPINNIEKLFLREFSQERRGLAHLNFLVSNMLRGECHWFLHGNQTQDLTSKQQHH